MQQAVITSLKSFFSHYPQTEYKRGSILIREGSQPTGVFFLEHGIVAMQVTTDEGNSHTLHLFKHHSFFPLTWALNQTDNQYQFIAVTPVTVRTAPIKHVASWLKKEPLVLFDLSQRLLSALSGVMRQVETLMSGTANNRVLTMLQTLAARFGKTQPEGGKLIDLKLSHQDIALLAGVSRETVTRELGKLVKERKIEVEGKRYKIIS